MRSGISAFVLSLFSVLLLSGCDNDSGDSGGSGPAPAPVTPVSNAEAKNDNYELIGNVRLLVGSGAAGVLANDVDLTQITDFDATSLQGGTITMFVDGSFTYEPPANFNGNDSFAYTASDGSGTVDTATVTLVVSKRVRFVKNDAPAGGNGTLTSPFNNLIDAHAAGKSGDVIYLFEGDGTTSGYDTGITLKNGQKLMGEGVDFDVNGGVLIPAGSFPNMSSAGGLATIRIGDNNTIAGIRVSSAFNSAIYGITKNNLTIRSSRITGATGHGVTLINVRGLIEIKDSSISGNGSHGLTVTNFDTKAVVLNIFQSSFNNNGSNGIFTNTNSNTKITSDLVNNSLDSNGGIGIRQTAFDGKKSSWSIKGNSFESSVDDSIRLTAQGNTKPTILAEANTFKNSNMDSIEISVEDTTISSLVVKNNDIDDSNFDGIDINLSDSAQADMEVAGNQVCCSQDKGIEFNAANSSDASILIDDNHVNLGNNVGLTFKALNSAKVVAWITGNSLVDNNQSSGTYGLVASTSNSSQLCLKLDGNASDTDFNLTAAGATSFDLEIGTNTGTVNQTGPIAIVPLGSCLL